MSMTNRDAFALVAQELERAQAAHVAFHSGHEGYAVLREELDELWDAVKASRTYDAYVDQTGYEAVQVAAMALRFLVDLCDAPSTEAYMHGRRKAG